MMKSEVEEYILNTFEEGKIDAVKCWVVTNEMSQESAVFSVEQEAIDLMKDLMVDPTYKHFETKREDGFFLTFENIKKLINFAHEEAKNW